MLRWLPKRGKPAQDAPPAEAAERLIAAGNRLEDDGDLAGACELYRQAVALAPGHANAQINLGIGLEASGDAAGARACYEKALEVQPASAAASYNLGKLLYAQGALREAAPLLQRALQSRPAFAEARIVHGYVLHGLGELDAAAAALEAGLKDRPDDAAARGALARVRISIALRDGVAHHQAGRRPEARAGYEQALELDPRNADALHFLGFMAYEDGSMEQAAELISRSLEAQAANAHARFNLGRIRQAQGRLDEALACYRTALELAAADGTRFLERHPDAAAALCDLGTALRAHGRLAEAIECYRKALEVDPAFFNGYYNLAIAERDQGRHEAAIHCFRRALELRPRSAQAHYGLGHVLAELDRMEEALACFRDALAADAGFVKARWSIAMAQLPAVYAAGEDPRERRRCFAAALGELEAWFAAPQAADGFTAVGSDQPFALAYQEEDNRELLERYGSLCARLMAQWSQREGLATRKAHTRAPLRVGIVSAHFRNHSVWNALSRGWLGEIDPQRFALQAFDLGSGEDEQTAFARARAASYVRGPKTLREWVDAIEACEPDVLIYPEIGMDPMTAQLASLRLAPVQAASWGHPETTGLPTIDYYLSAADLEPPDAQAHYREKLVCLPRLGCHFARLAIAAHSPDLSQAGAGAGLPLLVCPGVPFKYAPQHDWIFPEIAHRLGRCRFVFFTHWNRALSERLAVRLRAAFRARGMDDTNFLAFVPWQATNRFHGWLRHADAFLDTIGFSGFNTALHAVECALPIVTREGRFLRGRLASGILKRLGLQELVAPTEDAYVALAVRLVEDRAYRQSVAARMQASRSGLYEDAAPVRALEAFLTDATA